MRSTQPGGGPTAVSYSAWAMVGSLGRTRSSWLRELIASLVKTLPRWYWTVRALMNNWAPISKGSTWLLDVHGGQVQHSYYLPPLRLQDVKAGYY